MFLSSPVASVRAGFVHGWYSVREGDGEVRVCVGAFEPQKFGANFTVTVNTEDNTAGKLSQARYHVLFSQ